MPSSAKNSGQTRLAAIDVGTNSIHLVISDVDGRTGKLKILHREKEIARLGSGPSDMKYLSENSMNRGIETIRRFKVLADSMGATVRAVATSAVREAINQKDFSRRTEKETGVKLEIASGVEEARLIYLGVLQALPIFRKKIFLVDIGGGSSEFLIGQERDIAYANSLKIGALRLTRRFFNTDELKKRNIEECRRYIAGMISPIVREAVRHRCQMFVGTSGTVASVAAMVKLRQGDPAAGLNGFSFSADQLGEVVDQVLSIRDVRERASIKGLDPRRADIIVAGILILDELFRALEITSMVVSGYALREGIILDTFEKLHHAHGLHLHDIRYHSVISLAEDFRYERGHSHHVSDLALSIFDQTRRMHHMGRSEREFLEAAALLHEIGLYLSHAQHHRHSYYLIKNSDLIGFTENEKEIIANVARYHRKSHPKYKHENFGNLSSDDQEVIRRLAAILRIADGLDRSHGSRVSALRCKRRGKKLVVELKPAHRGNLELELWGAERKNELFEEVFNVKPRFVVK